MRNVETFFVLFAVIIPLSGLSQINSDSSADPKAGHCCNNNFPGYWIQYPNQKFNPAAPAGMSCDGVENDITRLICARYWSAYGPDPTEMCEYFPSVPPLPPIPIPGNFNVTRTQDNHPELSWSWYYVHWYRIYRKIDAGS